jgi:hypothetical protein
MDQRAGICPDCGSTPPRAKRKLLPVLTAAIVAVALPACGATAQSNSSTSPAADKPTCPPGYRYVNWDGQDPATSHTCHILQPDTAAGPIASAHPKCPRGFHGPYGTDHICWSNKPLIVAPKSG